MFWKAFLATLGVWVAIMLITIIVGVVVLAGAKIAEALNG